MCGNGLRCVVRHVLGDQTEKTLWVDTDAGLRRGEIEANGQIRATMGAPRIGRELAFTKDGKSLIGREISMGNPHFVLRPFDAPGLRAAAVELGPWVQAQREFPEGTNVELMHLAEDALELWVYERGAGLTQACGTGAAAAAIAADLLGLGGHPVRRRVRLPGGELAVELIRAEGGGLRDVAIIGEAVRVFEGVLVW
jgi:diaminopimelate epimerase